jgi:AP2 domain.
MTLTAAYLRERLIYDPETGVFTWRRKDGPGKDNARWNSRYAGRQAGSIDSLDGYVRIRIDGRLYKAQRLAWLYHYGDWPPAVLDHRDRNRSNNAIANLRLASLADNARNASLRKDSSSGRKGVTWLKSRNRWAAVIRIGGRQRCLGLYKDIDAAAEAYLSAAKKHFGEFATDGVSA